MSVENPCGSSFGGGVADKNLSSFEDPAYKDFVAKFSELYFRFFPSFEMCDHLFKAFQDGVSEFARIPQVDASRPRVGNV